MKKKVLKTFILIITIMLGSFGAIVKYTAYADDNQVACPAGSINEYASTLAECNLDKDPDSSSSTQVACPAGSINEYASTLAECQVDEDVEPSNSTKVLCTDGTIAASFAECNNVINDANLGTNTNEINMDSTGFLQVGQIMPISISFPSGKDVTVTSSDESVISIVDSSKVGSLEMMTVTTKNRQTIKGLEAKKLGSAVITATDGTTSKSFTAYVYELDGTTYDMYKTDEVYENAYKAFGNGVDRDEYIGKIKTEEESLKKIIDISIDVMLTCKNKENEFTISCSSTDDEKYEDFSKVVEAIKAGHGISITDSLEQVTLTNEEKNNLLSGERIVSANKSSMNIGPAYSRFMVFSDKTTGQSLTKIKGLSYSVTISIPIPAELANRSVDLINAHREIKDYYIEKTFKYNNSLYYFPTFTIGDCYVILYDGIETKFSGIPSVPNTGENDGSDGSFARNIAIGMAITAVAVAAIFLIYAVRRFVARRRVMLR